MVKMIIGGAMAFALLSGPAAAAAGDSTTRWVVTPNETGCRFDLELAGRSGAVMPVSLVSDGQVISMRFFKDDLPARAFLPIRIDRVRYSNLMLRGEDGAGELVLSEESEAALRRGKSLDIAWLGEEPLSVSLSGSEQGMSDLRICGAQTAARNRERAVAERAAKERAEAEARAKALNEAQAATLRAQAAAAEARRRQLDEAAAQQRQAEADADARYQAARQRQADAYARDRYYREARQRAYYSAQRRGYYNYYYSNPQPERDQADDQDDDRYEPATRPVWPPPYYYRRY